MIDHNATPLRRCTVRAEGRGLDMGREVAQACDYRYAYAHIAYAGDRPAFIYGALEEPGGKAAETWTWIPWDKVLSIHGRPEGLQ